MNTTAKNATPKPTAAETYDRRRQEIAILIDCLQMELERHDEEAKADPRNWGFAGDLGHVREQIKQILLSVMGFKDEAAFEQMIEEHLADMIELDHAD